MDELYLKLEEFKNIIKSFLNGDNEILKVYEKFEKDFVGYNNIFDFEYELGSFENHNLNISDYLAVKSDLFEN